MRVAIVLFSILLAVGAGAATRRAAPADAAGLRGSVSTGDKGAPAPVGATTTAARLRKTPPPVPALASPLPLDDGQCRRTCAHTYYRCLAGDYAEQCPQAWTLCLADCARATAGLR